jgi:hypothetical protein
MHDWSDEGVDWAGIEDAGAYIGYWLRKWVRMDVRQVKEKYGTVRVYCAFGFCQIYSMFYPGYCWIKPWWPHRLDLWISSKTPLVKWINCLVTPIQQWAYVWRYKKATQKWPHLRDEIISCADYGELFVGHIQGCENSSYWTTGD